MRLFELVINEDDATGLDAIALVDKPAIQLNAEKFANFEKFSIEPDEMIMRGAIMLADTPIYRYSEQLGEYYVKASPYTVKKCAIKMAKNGLFNSVNLQHDNGQKVPCAVLFESYFIDRERGINPPHGQDHVPDGSWYGAFKFTDRAFWDSQIKSDTVNGFSVEGVFDYAPINQPLNDDLETELDILLYKIKQLIK